jgi:fructose-1,6-bisphosphatase/inositol monophosphatase family enzyme
VNGHPGGDLLVGIPSSKDRLTVSVLREWAAQPGMVCRNMGSTALHLAMVASGALGAAFCKQCKIWDIAAGVLLVTEAGGRCTNVDGTDRLPFDLAADPNQDLPILAAAPKTHERLIRSIQGVSP